MAHNNRQWFYTATADLGDDPDHPGLRVVPELPVRLVNGLWYADVLGLPIQCRNVFGVQPPSGTPPFTLTPSWSATACPDSGEEYEAVVTGWDGDDWLGEDAPLDAMIANPRPRP